MTQEFLAKGVHCLIQTVFQESGVWVADCLLKHVWHGDNVYVYVFDGDEYGVCETFCGGGDGVFDIL